VSAFFAENEANQRVVSSSSLSSNEHTSNLEAEEATKRRKKIGVCVNITIK